MPGNDFDNFNEDDFFGDSINFASNTQSTSNNNSMDMSMLEDADDADLLASDDDDSFLDGDLSGTAEEDDGLMGNSTQSGDERERSLKKIAIFALIVAAVLIVIVCFITRIASNSKKAEQKTYTTTVVETQSSKQNTQTTTTQVNTQTAVQNSSGTSGSGWVQVDYTTFGTYDTEIESILTVTDVATYAKTLNNGEFQLRTEATGNIAGLTGTYTVDVPFNLTGAVKLGTQLNVVYNIGEQKGSKIVSNISIRSN